MCTHSGDRERRATRVPLSRGVVWSRRSGPGSAPLCRCGVQGKEKHSGSNHEEKTLGHENPTSHEQAKSKADPRAFTNDPVHEDLSADGESEDRQKLPKGRILQQPRGKPVASCRNGSDQDNDLPRQRVSSTDRANCRAHNSHIDTLVPNRLQGKRQDMRIERVPAPVHKQRCTSTHIPNP